jgi:hypothetical protein
MQHGASIKMSAAIDQGHAIPKRKRCSFPKLNARTFAHHPLTISGVQKYLRVEPLGPIDHCRVKVWMRDRNGAKAAARVHLGDGLFVQQSNAIPEQISSWRLQEQSALAYRKFRFGADSEKPWRFLFESIVMISRQPFERRPFLASVTNKLPFILANWAS